MKDPLKPRDKITQKMTRDGLVEVNETQQTAEHISKRTQDADFQKSLEQQAAPGAWGKGEVGEAAPCSCAASCAACCSGVFCKSASRMRLLIRSVSPVV